MADNKKLDAPENVGWRGFVKRTKAETVKNIRLRFPEPSARDAFMAYGMFPLMISNVAFMGYALLLDDNGSEAQNEALAALNQNAEIVADISQEGGYQIINASGEDTPTIVAIKIADEYKLYTVSKGDSDTDKTLTRITDPEQAFSRAHAVYAALDNELAARKGDPDATFDGHSEVFNMASLSEAFQIEGKDSIQYQASGWEHVSDGLLSIEALEALTQNWKDIQASISDGGYPDILLPDVKTVGVVEEETLGGAFLTLGAIYAGFMGTALAGGAGIAAVQTAASGVGRRRKRGKRPSPK